MTRAWLEPPPLLVPPDLAAAVGGHPLVAETLVRRGIATPAAARAFLDPDAYMPTPPEALPGLLPAVERLEAAIRAGEPICVWGDFDVDGQTATTVLVFTLADLGAQVTYHIPVRATEGHGVGLEKLREVIAAGARVILTCDTGIAAVEAAAFARSQGVDFIVTDHHDLPAVLPDAYAIVNPKESGVRSQGAGVRDQGTGGISPNGEKFPQDPIKFPQDPGEFPQDPAKFPQTPVAPGLRSLPGVGVAYKLAEALYVRAGQPEAADELLDLVALGIVADLAEVRGDTRYLLQRGLTLLRETRRLGLQVLMETAELTPANLTEEHIAFVIAPRLNALGRLADANVAVEFLTLGVLRQAQDARDTLTRARILAADLEMLNARRKLLCDQVDAAAEAQLRRDPTLLAAAALVLAGPGWPAGVIGIVASRLVDRYGKPTILLSLPPPGTPELARGSARSVMGIHITAAIAAQSHLLTGFGGHPMAAGLSLPSERVAEFRRGFVRTVAALSAESPDMTATAIDGELALGDLTPDFVADIERLAPFGPGNPPLTLVSRDLHVRGKRAVGRDQSHLLVIVEDAWGTAQEVIWWDGAGETLPEGKFDLTYTARANDYRGLRGIQVTWVDARPAVEDEVKVKPRAEIEVVDFRGVADPFTTLRQLQTDPAVLVWGEGESTSENDLRTMHYALRTTEHVAPHLAIWTTPPGPTELRAALAAVKPARVYLFGLDPGLDRPDPFLRRLGGLVKHALRARAGRMRISELAVATAAREATVRQGLRWLVARGNIVLIADEGEELVFTPGDGVSQPEMAALTARLESLLAETAAYRRYFATADKSRLIR